MKMSACPTVSELGASESNEGDGSSLKSSGTSDLDVLSFLDLGALAPLGIQLELWRSFAFSISPGFKDDTGLSIAGHKSGIGESVDSCFLFIN